jgi:hypothetical protein
MNRFHEAGLATPVITNKKIYLRAQIKINVLQISEIIDLDAFKRGHWGG